MNESEERFVDALKTENEKHKKDIAELTHRIKELEEAVEDWRNKYDRLKDAVMLII